MTVFTLIKVTISEVREKLQNGDFSQLPEYEFTKNKTGGLNFKKRLYNNDVSEPIFTTWTKNNNTVVAYSTDSKAYQSYIKGELENLTRRCRVCRQKFKGVGLPIPKKSEIRDGKIIYHGIGAFCYRGACTLHMIRILYKGKLLEETENMFNTIWSDLHPDIALPEYFNPDLLIENDGSLEVEEMVGNQFVESSHIVLVPAKQIYYKH